MAFLLVALSHNPGERFDALARCASMEGIEALMAVWDDDAIMHLGWWAHYLESDTGRMSPVGE